MAGLPRNKVFDTSNPSDRAVVHIEAGGGKLYKQTSNLCVYVWNYAVSGSGWEVYVFGVVRPVASLCANQHTLYFYANGSCYSVEETNPRSFAEFRRDVRDITMDGPFVFNLTLSGLMLYGKEDNVKDAFPNVHPPGLNEAGGVIEFESSAEMILAGGGRLYKSTPSGIYVFLYEFPNPTWILVSEHSMSKYIGWTAGRKGLYLWVKNKLYRYTWMASGFTPYQSEVSLGVSVHWASCDDGYLFYSDINGAIKWEKEDDLVVLNDTNQLGTKFASHEAELTALKNKVASLETELASLRQVNASNAPKLAALEAHLVTAKQHDAAEEAKIQALQNELTAVKNHESSDDTKITLLETQIANLQQNAFGQSKFKSLEAEIASLKELEKTYHATMEERRQESDARIDTLVTVNTELTASVDLLKEQVAALKKSFEDSQKGSLGSGSRDDGIPLPPGSRDDGMPLPPGSRDDGMPLPPGSEDPQTGEQDQSPNPTVPRPAAIPLPPGA